MSKLLIRRNIQGSIQNWAVYGQINGDSPINLPKSSRASPIWRGDCEKVQKWKIQQVVRFSPLMILVFIFTIWQISLNKLILKLAGEVAEQVVDPMTEGKGPSDDGAEMDKKHPQVLIPGFDFHDESSDLVVEMQDSRLIGRLKSVFLISILICIVIANCALVVPSRDDIDMVVQGLVLSLNHSFILEVVDLGLGVLLFQLWNVVLFAEVQLMDCVGHV